MNIGKMTDGEIRARLDKTLKCTHTPGPWGARRPHSYGNKEYAVEASRSRHGRVVIADLVYSADDRQEGNARLIAAAPDLLAACVACLGRDDIAEGELGDMLRAAVERATA